MRDIGIITNDADEPIMLPSSFALVNPKCEHFLDGRAGTDRWGRERKQLEVCGTGWDEYSCAAYRDESCPGDFNRGTRNEPLRTYAFTGCRERGGDSFV